MNLCLYCTCMGKNTVQLSEEALRKALGTGVRFLALPRLCSKAELNNALPKIKEKVLNYTDASLHVALLACAAKGRGSQALSLLSQLLPEARLELADIREGCLWAEKGVADAERAFQAAALARMALVRTEPLLPSPAEDQAPSGILVVGAGPAGLSAASSLARLGLAVTLVDKRPKIGGMAAVLGTLFPRFEAAENLLAQMPVIGITLHMGSEVKRIRRDEKGSSYLATIVRGSESREEAFSAVILATGAQPVLPGSAFSANKRKNVISQLELDTLLTAIEKGAKKEDQLAQDYVFVQCVHARTEERPYCSAICCPTAVKNALRIKKLRPDTSVTVLNRQMVMPGLALEALLRSSMEKGVRYLHVDTLDDITPLGEEKIEAVLLPSSDIKGERKIAADVLVCSTPILPPPSQAALIEELALTHDSFGFLQGHEPAHPLESNCEGIFLAGSARAPSSVDQALEQGRAAAALAAGYLKTRRMPVNLLPYEAQPARILPERCSGCGRCAEACPHAAIRMDEGAAHVLPEICQGCGVCSAVCPSKAAYLPLSSPTLREIYVAHQRPGRRSRT